ncbi:hypothetical protein [Eisenibacter elegans]|uniref:hypothetical protein n=1 Tax=Eisenibacter elegans TaxID=997 RepID=UPI00041FC3A4|nr:hypothetical protein [Eisenibacter elegans]
MQKRLSAFLLIAILSIALLPTELWAQGRGGNRSPEEMAERKTAKLDEVVKLSDAQKTTIRAAHLEAEQKRAEVKARIKAKYPDKEQMKANRGQVKQEFGPEMKAINQARKQTIQATLTPEQQEAWKAYKAEQRQNRGQSNRMQDGNKGGNKGGQGGNKGGQGGNKGGQGKGKSQPDDANEDVYDIDEDDDDEYGL